MEAAQTAGPPGADFEPRASQSRIDKRHTAHPREPGSLNSMAAFYYFACSFLAALTWLFTITQRGSSLETMAGGRPIRLRCCQHLGAPVPP